MAGCDAVIVVFPAPTIDSFPLTFENLATDSSLDSNLNTAELVDDGFANVKASSPTVRTAEVNAPRTGVARPTINSVVTEIDS